MVTEPSRESWPSDFPESDQEIVYRWFVRRMYRAAVLAFLVFFSAAPVVELLVVGAIR